MSFQELSDSFGVMFSAFSLPMKAERNRNKERLEAILAGLYELQLLKQRQESRVLSALCLGDCLLTCSQPWEALRSGRCARNEPSGDATDDSDLKLQTCTSWAIRATLEKQVAEQKMNNDVKSDDSTDLEDNQLNAGEVLVGRHIETPESNYHPVITHSLLAPERIQETETKEKTWLSDPTQETMVALGKMKDVDPSQQDCQLASKVETYIFGLIQRRTLPTRPSKPRTSLAHDTLAVSVVRQSSLCQKDEQQLTKQVSVVQISTPPQCSEGTASQAGHNLDKEHFMRSHLTEDSPPHYHHLQQSVQHQPGLYHKTRQASMVSTSRLTSLDYSSCRVLHANTDPSTSESDSPQHYRNYPSPPVLSKPHQMSSHDELLVSADYIPAQLCRASTRASAHHHSNPHKGSGVPRTDRSTYLSERATLIQTPRTRTGPKKCRSNEDGNVPSRKPGKKACRSQSENSLQRIPERKYNTVERDGGGSGGGGRGSHSSQSRNKKHQQGSSSYRRWQSTLELSQDEADQPPKQTLMQNSLASNQKDRCLTRARKSRPTLVSYAYPHHSHNHHLSPHHQHLEFQSKMDQMQLCQRSENYPHPGQCESESSMSEADSRDSSSLSSDSDESGGLVWPQQLPPQLCFPSLPVPPGVPLQTKAFVKIKASHALKKKILRFRTGSLKVMTTV
uniref:Dishevelled-binding antagonist of beta-catenin 3a n=1 Tax=Amphiprion percula TaxID=161767 RepID=A0A3P8SZM5_AMPPE